MSYDANGNITALKQYGLKVTTSTVIDDLEYKYLNTDFSNKLLSVKELTLGSNDNKLGDFTDLNTTNDDYTYDNNGNLLTDKNKNITAITYNYLNLPQSITTTKGIITYTYDASGRKLKKNVNETGKTTQYIGGFVYENDVLQFMGHEEGRIRYNTATSSWVYDYFIKDNLGNVRMVLTEQEQSDQYPALSFEGSSGSQQVNDQNAFWEKSDGQPISVTAARVSRPGAFGTQGTNGDYVQLLRKSTGSIGATKLMKVMAGDKIHVKVDYYHNISSVNNSGADGLSSMISSLLGAISSSSATSALFKTHASSITTGLNSHTDVTSFFAPEYGSGGTAPKAYLHVLLFDERFKFDQANSFVQQVSSSTGTNTINKFAGNAVEVKKSGYAFVYISNEGDQLVYFDNLLLTHERGRILEENHYYPFGLTQAGLGSKALTFGGANNKFKYNGKEEQRREFSDGTGLDWSDYGARMYDAQIGRWFVIDPLAEVSRRWSTYVYAYDNPIKFIDPDGMEAIPGSADDVLYSGDMSFMKKKRGTSEELEKSGDQNHQKAVQSENDQQVQEMAQAAWDKVNDKQGESNDEGETGNSAVVSVDGLDASSFSFTKTSGNWQEAGVKNLKIKITFIGGPRNGEVQSAIIQYPLIFGLPTKWGPEGEEKDVTPTMAANFAAFSVNGATDLTTQTVKLDGAITREQLVTLFIKNIKLMMAPVGGRVDRSGSGSPKIKVKEASYDLF